MKKTSNINLNTFLNPDKYAAYVLGVIWGDGTIENTTRRKRITVHCITEDAKHFYSMFEKTGKWNINHNKQQKHWKPQSNIRASSKEVVDFLVSLDCSPNTKTSANKILQIIPKELHKYFILGIIDADGCFYVNKKTYTYHFVLSGPYQQDWSYFTDILKELNIKYNEDNIISNKGHTHSRVRIIGKKRIQLFGKYLYSDDANIIGLPRKLNKYKLMF